MPECQNLSRGKGPLASNPAEVHHHRMSTDYEERLSHLQRMVDDLSEVVARQDTDIERLKKHLSALIDRERDRDAASGSIALGDERPPHY